MSGAVELCTDILDISTSVSGTAFEMTGRPEVSERETGLRSLLDRDLNV